VANNVRASNSISINDAVVKTWSPSLCFPSACQAHSLLHVYLKKALPILNDVGEGLLGKTAVLQIRRRLAIIHAASLFLPLEIRHVSSGWLGEQAPLG
jgi:hypothetical protein